MAPRQAQTAKKSTKGPASVCTAREYQDLLSKVEQLEADKQELADEVKRLNAQKRARDRQIIQLKAVVADAEKQARVCSEAASVGFHIRLRFLEQHRQRMRDQNDSEASCPDPGDALIKMGNEAAHRGRPLVDARIVECGAMDEAVFKNLYGIQPERLDRWVKIPELYEVVGMRGSLRSAGVRSPTFELVLGRLLHLEASYEDVEDLQEAFESIPTFLNYVKKLTEHFDILEKNGKIQSCYSRKTGTA